MVMLKSKKIRPVPELHHQSFDYTNNVTKRVLKIISEFTDGFEFLAGLKRPVTIFGSARTPRTSRYYRDARVLGKKLGKAGFTIVTGGGPGIMEAANKGALEAKTTSVGLNIQLPHQQQINKYVTKGIGFYYFFSRKAMMTMSAQAYVFFPAGYGTLDELFSILTLIQTKKIERRPVVLYGKDYWRKLRYFILENMLKRHKTIAPGDANLFTIVDRVDEAAKVVMGSKERVYTSM